MERTRRETAPEIPTAKLDVQEHGARIGGQPQVMNRRLFMQLSVYRCPAHLSPAAATKALCDQLQALGAMSVIYHDVHDARSFGLLLWDQNPTRLIESKRTLFSHADTSELVHRPELAMLGRTYSSGFEPDLQYWLLDRPQQTVLNPQWPWAIWYPLRRKGSFERLESDEQRAILGEHARVGRTYGEQDLAHDVRLACHGLDPYDNDFVIGLLGKELHPLSHVVQSMRKTRQTSEYIERMGPFFVGYVEWRHAGKQTPF